MGDALQGVSIGRPLVIPLFIPHMGCPHRCIFCNQHAITGSSNRPPSPERIRREVNCFLKYAKHRPSSIQISFFGGNFLGLDRKTIRTFLKTAQAFVNSGRVDSIRFSTRPDTVNPATVKILREFPLSTVELGVQSMNDRILDIAQRGHLSSDTRAATGLLKASGYQVGLQMMVGLPGDDDAGALRTARRIVALEPDFVRIYPTLVLRGSPLAGWYQTSRYRPLALEDCVSLVKQIYLYFKSHGIPVIRMGLQASDGLAADGDLIAGPYHPAFGHLVHSEIVFDAISSSLREMASIPEALAVHTHPRTVSRVQGLNRQNVSRLKKAFGLKHIRLVQDEDLEPHHMKVAGKAVVLP